MAPATHEARSVGLVTSPQSDLTTLDAPQLALSIREGAKGR